MPNTSNNHGSGGEGMYYTLYKLNYVYFVWKLHFGALASGREHSP